MVLFNILKENKFMKKIINCLLIFILYQIIIVKTFAIKYDTTIACNTCHSQKKYAQHILSIEGTELKTTFPIFNNKIDCLTCHTHHYRDPNSLKEKNDPSTTYLLRISNAPVSLFCLNCHDDKKNIIGSKHDLNISAPDEKNLIGQTTKKMGQCSACHLIHNGIETNLWAKKLPFSTNIISMFCFGCHNEKGCAKNRILNDFSHPYNINIIQKGLTTTLPLFNEDGKIVFDGKITCSTCHEVHNSLQDESTVIQDDKKNNLKKDNTIYRFLRINNKLNSELCTNCHKVEGLIVRTPHDLAESIYNEENIKGDNPIDNGTCSSCHLMHNGYDKEKFARKYGSGEDIITKKCLSCHQDEKIKDDNSHPINVSIPSWRMTSNLPLFDQDGKISDKGTIKCITCHNIHRRIKSKFESESDKEEKKFLNETYIQKIIIGEVIYSTGDKVYVDQINNKIEVKKDDILSIIRNDLIIARIKVLNINPFAKESEIFANLITKGAANLIKGDKVFNPKLLNKLDLDVLKKVKSNKFLNITNENSELCLNCHKEQETILKTKHDLKINFPQYKNLSGQNISQFGQCSPCHTVHNTNKRYLLSASAINNNEVIDIISKVCKNCHSQGNVAASKDQNNHHPIILFSLTKKNLIPPPDNLPLYDLEGNMGFWDYVSCSTCHNVHQWAPMDNQKREIIEGNSMNSFLRIINNKDQLCESCHTDELDLKNKTIQKKEEDNSIDKLEEKNKPITISEGGPKIKLLTPKDNSILNNYEVQISGEIDNPSISKGLVLINGKKNVISMKDGLFKEKIIIKEGKNILRVLATDLNGKSGTSNEIICYVDTRKPKIIKYEYPNPVGLMDDFQIKIIFNQSMNPNILPFICFITKDKKIIVLENSLSIQSIFYNKDENIPPFNTYTFSNMEQGDVLLNSESYFGYDNLPEIAIRDNTHDKITGPGNDEISVMVFSRLEPEGQRFILKENKEFNGIFNGKIEFSRWRDLEDKMIAVEDNDPFTITYYLSNFLSTYQLNDTFITNTIKITKEMEGINIITVENAQGVNTNIIEKDDSKSIIINPSIFYIMNDQPAAIMEGKNSRSRNIHLKFFVDNAQAVILSENPDFENSKWELYEETKNFILSENGEVKTIYIKFKNKFNIESQKFSLNIEYVPIEFKRVLKGNIDSTLVLTKDMGPFLIREPLNIGHNATLIIESGARFWIDASQKEKIKIIVKGKLITNGNENNRIIFTSNALLPESYDWEGIEFINSSGNSLKYTNIEYANSGLNFINSNAIVDNCKINYNKNAGIICENHSNPYIILNEFQNNGIGIITRNISIPEIINNLIFSNEIGILCENMSSPKIIINSIMKNSYAGIKCTDLSSPPISDNNISQNSKFGIYINGASPMLNQNSINENSIGIFCENFKNPFLIKRNNIFNNKEYSIKLSKFNRNLDASKNWWGIKNFEIIEKFIYDRNDEKKLGKIYFTPIIETPFISKNTDIEIDKTKPKLLICEYQNPANITSNFQISFVFDEALNPYLLPMVTLISQNLNKEINVQSGRFSSINMENDTYISSDIVLDEIISGQIDIYIENIQDLTGNTIDKIHAGSFLLDPTLKIKEGNYVSSPTVTLMIKANDIFNMMIDENPEFKNKSWEQFSSEKQVQLSKEGENTIYVSLFCNTGKILPKSQIKVILDRISPRIIEESFNVPKIDDYFNLKLFFNEQLDPLKKIKITLKSSNNNEFILPEGELISTNLNNDTYAIQSAIIPENLEGYISVLIENATDLAGNKISSTYMNNLFYYDIIPPSPLVKIKNGNYTQNSDIALLFEEQKDYPEIEVIFSENKDLKDAEWEQLKKEKNFKLSSSDGEKNIYLKFRDKAGYASSLQKITLFLDTLQPKIIDYKYPVPIRVNKSFQIKIQFNESLDTTFIPEVNLISTGAKNPIIYGNGAFTSLRNMNDTYITPPIILDEDMGGAITVVVSKAIDLAKNEMELVMNKSFNFDSYFIIPIEIKQGQTVNNPKVNFYISSPGIKKMIVSEDIRFKDINWEEYKPEKEFILSPEDGLKKVFFKFEDDKGNVSKIQTVEITLDRIKPVITSFDLPKDIEYNKPFTFSINFNKEIKNQKPLIILMSSSGFNYFVINEGKFVDNKIKNNIYITPDIILDESMKGKITIFVDNIKDIAENKMDAVYQQILDIK